MTLLNFNIGAKIYCQDEPCGTLHKVVFDPEDENITNLIVERGFLFTTDRVVPVDLVEAADEKGVHLSVSSDALEDYPAYEKTELEKPRPGWKEQKAYETEGQWMWTTAYSDIHLKKRPIPRIPITIHEGVPTTQVVIERGTPVVNEEGEIGSVDHVLIEPEDDQAITHIIVRRGVIPEYVIVSAGAIDEVSERGIAVTLTDAAIDDLPRYTPRPDLSIQQGLRERLAADDRHLDNVTVRVKDGVVHLRGLVPDIAAKRHTEALAYAAPGVIDVENALDTDVVIEARVAAALMSDPRTWISLITVESEAGAVTLEGKVDHLEIAEVAEKLAAQQPGVKEVHNALRVEPDVDTPALLTWTRPGVHLTRESV